MTAGICCFFNDTATTEIYTLSLHDALPIFPSIQLCTGTAEVLREPENLGEYSMASMPWMLQPQLGCHGIFSKILDRKSTRLNSSHANISYAVFCLKKKNSLQDSSPITLSGQ